METSSTTPKEEEKKKEKKKQNGLRRLLSKFRSIFRSNQKADNSTAPPVQPTAASALAQPVRSAHAPNTQSSERLSSPVVQSSTQTEAVPASIAQIQQQVPLASSTSATPPVTVSTSTPQAQPQQYIPPPQSSTIAIEAEDEADDPDLTATETDPPSGNIVTVVEPLNPTAVDLEKSEATKRFERAQAVFQKYNIDFSEDEWDMYPKIQVERVHKAPRMRVKWTCHECKTTFGHNKICVECAHQRCKECVRYPVKKKKSKTSKSKPVAEPIMADNVESGACHECQTTFSLGVTECTNCHHKICDRCLQETVVRSQQPQPTIQPATAAG